MVRIEAYFVRGLSFNQKHHQSMSQLKSHSCAYNLKVFNPQIAIIEECAEKFASIAILQNAHVRNFLKLKYMYSNQISINWNTMCSEN